MGKATRDHFGECLIELAAENENVFVVSCDLAGATRTATFKKTFPKRFIECGIAEANAISIAAGMAQEGLRPLVCSFGHFLTGKFLEIFQSVGLNNSGVVLVGTHAGLAIGKDGPTQMGLRDLALMRLLPNMEIISPADGVETRQAVAYTLKTRSPTYLRLGRQLVPETHDDSYTFSFGSPDEVRKGEDLLIVSQGGPVPIAVEASQSLVSKGVMVGVLNVSSLPLDTEKFCSLIAPYNKLLIVEDHFQIGGLADALAITMLKQGISKEVSHVAVPDYAQAGDPKDLYDRYNLDLEGIKKKCLEML